MKHNGFKMAISSLFALLLSAVLTGCAIQAPEEGDYSLKVLHINDVHSNYGGFTKDRLLCYEPLCAGGTGGIVRLEQAVHAIRNSDPHAILFDAGDEFQGTLFWTVHKEKPPLEFMKILDYIAFTPGNHEFDDGNETFLRFIKNLDTPVLAANLSFEPYLEHSELIYPWAITEIKGRKVGIIGITCEFTPLTSSPGPEARFASEKESLRSTVNELTNQGIDIIIALTHVGLDRDRDMARDVAGVDIIIGGHSHSLLSNTDSKADGPYPLVENSPEGKPVLIVTAATGCNYLGVLDVVFDDKGVPVLWNGQPVSLDDQTLIAMNAPAPNERLVEIVEEFAVAVRSVIGNPVGIIKAPMQDGRPLESPNVMQCREVECLTGNITADAMLNKAFASADAVLLNGGALRGSLPSGTVTAGDVLTTVPFQNTPLIADVPGSVILEALEHGVSSYGQGEGRFLQVAGMRYVFDPRNPVGSRIIKVEIKDRSGEWRTVENDKSYRIITPDYLARGGDGFSMLIPMNWQESQILMNDALRIYLEQNSPLTVDIEDRIKIAN